MATELDKLIVKIEADLKDLKKGMAQANKVVGNSTNKMTGGLKKLNQSMNRITATATKVGAVLAVAFGAVFIKGVIDTGIQIENLQIRLKALFGTAREGERAFEAMLSFAGQVPFTLGEIQQASGNLAVVAKDADELSEVLKITGNVASVTGLDFRQTAEQIQRSFSGGIASADIFRERGVRDLLGFSAGAKVSAEETREAFERVFGAGGIFGDVTDELAGTLTGTLSMIKDKFMQFQIAVSESFFTELKHQFGDLNVFLDANQDKIQEIGRNFGETLANAVRFMVDNIDNIKRFFVALAGIAVINALATLTNSINTLTIAMARNPVFAIAVAISAGTTQLILGINAVKDMVGANDELNASLEAQEKEFERVRNITKKYHEDKAKAKEAIKEEARAIIELNKKLAEERHLRASMNKIKMDREAEIRGEAFDLEMEQLDKINQKFEDVGKSISKAFGEAVVSGKDFKDSLVDIFQSVLQQVVALIFQLQVIDPLLKQIKESMEATQMASGGGSSNIFQRALGFILGGSGGSTASLTNTDMIMGGLSGTAMPLGGARAIGGNVNPNMPYMVGERGAEMFVPKSAGTIVPNNQLGGSIVIEQNLNFATGVSQTVRAEVLNLLPAIKENTLSAVREARLRGGTFAKDFGA